MGIVFRQGTVLYIATDTHKYKFLVGEVTASQTFIGSLQKIRTIQNKELIDRSFVTEKGVANLSFSTHLGRGAPERELCEWFDMPLSSGTTHNIVTSASTPSIRDVYIKSNNTVYHLPDAVGINLSLKIGKDSILSASVTATATDMLDITGDTPAMSIFNGLTEESQVTSEWINSNVDIAGYEHILGVTLELTRTIKWLKQKSIFDIGSIYKVATPVIDLMAISGSITKVKLNNNNNVYTPSSAVDIQYGANFQVYLESCTVTERWDLGNFHREVSDYVLLPQTTTSFIKF